MMDDFGIQESHAVRNRLHQQAENDLIRITNHAHQEMINEDVSLEEVREVLLDAAIIENYPAHKRGSCCLVCRLTSRGRYIHVVCSTSHELAIIITVYEPKEPKWTNPFERGKQS